jgi:hypothetical protein
MFSFDHPNVPEWFGASTADKAADVFMLPLTALWGPWAGSHLPNGLEWLLFAANSALWGAATAATMTRSGSRIKKSLSGR